MVWRREYQPSCSTSFQGGQTTKVEPRQFGGVHSGGTRVSQKKADGIAEKTEKNSGSSKAVPQVVTATTVTLAATRSKEAPKGKATGQKGGGGGGEKERRGGKIQTYNWLDVGDLRQCDHPHVDEIIMERVEKGGRDGVDGDGDCRG